MARLQEYYRKDVVPELMKKPPEKVLLPFSTNVPGPFMYI